MDAPTKGLILRIAEIEVHALQLDAYLRLLTEEIDASLRLEEGVLMLNAVALADAPTQIRLMEAYADRDAYEAHLKTPHFLKYKAQTAGMVLSLRLVEATPVRLAFDRRTGEE